ncbi:MAG: hypothetical protein ACI4OE_02195 [Alphaproteobacteria bacterium]
MLKRCLTLVGLVYTLSLFNISDAAAKICFLPDSSCGTGKISSVKPNPAQCLYSSMAQAQNGMSSCEKAYKQNFCFYRRCKTREEDKNVFSNYSDCQKALEDNQTCQSCGGCYKIVTNANPTPKTCNETEATCSAKGKAFEANGEYDSNNVACGSCKVIETCPSGYSTAYQSQKDCKTGETFSSNGTANGKVCGKCTYQCSDYTLTSKKNENCYSCTPCPYDSSKYKCTESVKSGYQLVNGVCSKKPEDKILTCEEWIKEKYAGYTIYNAKQSSLSPSSNAILASGSVTIPRTGVMRIVGPKYFNYEECQKLDTPTITITNATRGLVNAYKINMIFDVDMSKDTSISAAIQPNVTSGQSMTISDASISAPGGVIRLSNFAKLLLEGNTSIKTDCHYDHSHYGCRAIDAFGNESSSTESIKVTVVTGSNVSITGALYIYSNAMLTVEKNATINITEKGRDAALFVNQSGYTPTYYARNGVHNYGILKTDSYGAHAGQVNCYSGSKFSTSMISVVSTGYPGRIKYEKQTNIKIGRTCKTPSSAGEYKFTSTITSNPISGSSCSF